MESTIFLTPVALTPKNEGRENEWRKLCIHAVQVVVLGQTISPINAVLSAKAKVAHAAISCRAGTVRRRGALSRTGAVWQISRWDIGNHSQALIPPFVVRTALTVSFRKVNSTAAGTIVGTIDWRRARGCGSCDSRSLHRRRRINIRSSWRAEWIPAVRSFIAYAGYKRIQHCTGGVAFQVGEMSATSFTTTIEALGVSSDVVLRVRSDRVWIRAWMPFEDSTP